ncbi:MAG: hypothetical protein ACOZNI_32345 [Myxococcota bacterium]
MYALLLVACTGTPPTDTGPDADTDVDTDTDADTDADADTDPPGDTGVAAAYWVGGFEADGTTFVAGRFGWSYYGLAAGEWVCTATGQFDYDGEAPGGCPGCTWAWDLSALRDSLAVGDACQSGDIAWSDGDLDGYVDYAWAFAETYEYDYNGTPLTFEDNVLLHGTYGWFVFAFNLPDYGIYETYGDAASIEMYRVIRNAEGAPYYYFYYP